METTKTRATRTQPQTRTNDTLTRSLTRLTVYSRENQHCELFTCELDLTRLRGRFWRGGKCLGSLPWDARRERFTGWLELPESDDDNPEDAQTELHLDSFEAQLRELIVKMFAVSRGASIEDLAAVERERRAEWLHGSRALYVRPLRLVADAAE